MSLRVRVFSSGSGGNAALYSAGNTHILLDCGISCKRIVQGLELEGIEPGELSGIFISHEHKDHVAGLRVLMKKTSAPVFVAPESLDTSNLTGIGLRKRGSVALTGGSPVILGPVTVTPFLVPHDAASCFGFNIEAGGVKITQVTDLGVPTNLVRERIRGSHCVLLEFNHDLDRLINGGYPLDIKMRIKGSLGHLSNNQAADLVEESINGECEALYLMHLSKENNLPELAEMAAREKLAGTGTKVFRTCEECPAEAWEG